MLVHKHLKSHGFADIRQVKLITIVTLTIVTMLLTAQQSGEAGVPEHVPVVEGAADPPVRGHRSEQPGAVQLLAVQETPLQEVGGPGGVPGGVAGEAGGPQQVEQGREVLTNLVKGEIILDIIFHDLLHFLKVSSCLVIEKEVNEWKIRVPG